jgi:PAS domain S-box-containing protein
VIGDGYFMNVGHGIKRLLGIHPNELTEKYFQQIIEEVFPLIDGIPKNRIEARNQIITGDIPRYKSEVLVKTFDGEKRWIKDTAIPIIDNKSGKAIGLTGILFDITEQKNTLIQLERTRERATESDRLKTAFLNNLSHEIRTPLNAIVGFTTLLGEPGSGHNNRMEFMDIITHSSDHLLEIVDDIVEISKIETKIVRLIKKETNINEMLQRIYKRFKDTAAEKNIELKFVDIMKDEQVIMVTDGYKLFQSMANLVGNAVKFTNAGTVEFGFHIKDEKIQFFVCDTGIGIGKEHKPHIFNPFYQAESSSTQRYDGTGLGLSIAKAYIELLGGQIWFSSEEGIGSIFCFSIPDTRK